MGLQKKNISSILLRAEGAIDLGSDVASLVCAPCCVPAALGDMWMNRNVNLYDYYQRSWWVDAFFCFGTQCSCVPEAIVIVAAVLSFLTFPSLPSPPPSLIPPFTTPSAVRLICPPCFPSSQSDFTHRLIAVGFRLSEHEIRSRLAWSESCYDRYIYIYIYISIARLCDGSV
jgi:hypothetical protein